jgi:long-chain acyl-CoA synthetase
MTDKNLAHMFFNRAKKYGERTCMLVKKDGEWTPLSWNYIGDTVRNLSLGLISLGLKQGEKVSLLSENRPKWAFSDLATLSAGGIVVTIYATNTPDQVQYIIDNSDSKFVVVSNNNQLQKVLEVSDQLPKLEHIIIFEPISGITDKDPRVKSFLEVSNLGRDFADPDEFDRRIEGTDIHQVATLIYTSGTTGDPKGVQLTHNNLYSNVEATSKVAAISDSDTALSFLPLSHSLERMAGYYTPIYNGTTIAYAESVDALIQNIGEVHPTIMVSVPRIYEKIHARILGNAEAGGALKKKIFDWSVEIGGKVSKRKVKHQAIPAVLKMQYKVAEKLVFSKLKHKLGGRLRFFVSGGAPLAQPLAEFFHSAGVLILEGYGLTETSPVITANTINSYKFGTVGKPIPGIEIKIAEDGEILSKGPNVMVGYYKKEEDTAQALEGGWFHTGDIGEIDEEGFLKITDRKKDLIVTAGGKNIAPQNIELLLKMEKYVEQVNVVGDTRKYLVAVIVPSFEEVRKFAKANEISFETNADLVGNEQVYKLVEDAVKRVNSQLAKYETIKKFVLSDIEFTQENGMITPTLKIKRKIVNAHFADRIDALYKD